MNKKFIDNNMDEQSHKKVENSIKKEKFIIKSKEDNYRLTIINEKDDITFIIENLKDFPVKIYELKTTLNELKKKEDCFYGFITAEKFVNNGIKKSIDGNKIALVYSQENKCITLEMRHDIFDADYIAKIKIPEKEQDLKEKVDSLTDIVSELRDKIKKIEEDQKKNDEKEKEDAAINSFVGTSFLQNDEKKMISEWIHPKKVIKFALLYNNANDSDGSNYFHMNCDGVFPTVTVVLDTSGRRFGGYSTKSWSQSPAGASYSRAPDSFIFNLSQKKKYNLKDQMESNAVYRHNSYGPTFGGGHDLYLANSCRSNNNSYCNKSSYLTENVNLLGSGGSTNFQVSSYEVYQVIFE